MPMVCKITSISMNISLSNYKNQTFSKNHLEALKSKSCLFNITDKKFIKNHIFR